MYAYVCLRVRVRVYLLVCVSLSVAVSPCVLELDFELAKESEIFLVITAYFFLFPTTDFTRVSDCRRDAANTRNFRVNEKSEKNPFRSECVSNHPRDNFWPTLSKAK